MFKLDQNRTFKSKVPIPVPGASKDAILELEYIFKDRDQIKVFMDSLPSRDDEESLLEIVCGWKDVDAEFSPESFTKLLKNYPGSARAILDKYLAEVSVSKTKN